MPVHEDEASAVSLLGHSSLLSLCLSTLGACVRAVIGIENVCGMADTEPIDADSTVEPDAEPDVSSDLQRGKAKLSRRYETWGFVPAGKRSAGHKGAQCIPCANHARKKGIALNPLGSCHAEIQAILAHVKDDCPHQTSSAKAAATAELQTLRNKRKPADKRPFAAMSVTDTAGSSGSGNSGLARFMALKVQPLTAQEQK